MLASAVALVLVGLTGMWLWFHATADARQDLTGVVVSADAVPGDPEVSQPDDPATQPDDPAAQTDGTAAQTDGAAATQQASAQPELGEADRDAVAGRGVTVDTLLATLRAARGDLTALSEDIVAQVEKDRAKAASTGKGSSGPAQPAAPVAPAPQPVNPAPVTPPGMCWDDDEWEECDDDWDDDDWDDDWDD